MSKMILSYLCCVLLFGCAKPTDPESLSPTSGGYRIVARVQTPAYAQDLELKDTLAYVAQGEGGLAIVSIADRSHPRVLSVCQDGVRGYSYKVTRKDTIVYLAAGGFGINTIKVSDPYIPAFMQHYGGASSTFNVEIFGTWLLEAKGENGVRFGDVSDGGFFDPRGTIFSPGYAHGMATTVDSNLVLACGEMGFAVYDLRDIDRTRGFYDNSKKYSAWVDLPGYAVDVTTMGNQSIAFVACGSAGVQVVDFSDTTNARVVGSYATGGYAKEVAYMDGRVYVTTELRGLQILAVNNPASPQLVGVVDTEFALGVAVDQHYVYVADETEGLIIIAIPPY